MLTPSSVISKIKQISDKLNPVPFFDKINREIIENEQSVVQQEIDRLGLALDEYLRMYIRNYKSEHVQIYKNFNFVYQSSHNLKLELRTYLNDWIASNCDSLFQCFVDINVKPEYGFHIDQQILVYLSQSSNKNRLSDTTLYRVLRFSNSTITILHTQSSEDH